MLESASGVTVAIIEAAFAAKLTWKVAECSRNGSSSGPNVSDSFRLLGVAFTFGEVVEWNGHGCLCLPFKMNSTVLEILMGKTGEEDSKRKKPQKIDHDGKLSALPIPRI